ncbi:2-C-methyl-D-erythritol 2,4-cyclodiphosphate synthase [Rhodopirellula sp. MGV]|uniref:2-C-methyl-D-erythritol 2,4-cyclodiphosphate synthase n=1 Tax=Rhodopirellula sp. MGV TaxID=2023130 RepID=UPI000B961704|nr:2-C-methyl-D-erythritol 2,4-cyclodiphosphate synthase [Rhodopirellula sp. MGV]OYP39114.1 2-C-methyl-D-erythritol 2,4-cyclodiphosphate synthase [Rhodopirellula sp. MGV]PNY35508.1 2-C-methyl-D-erythritol 2,4-cyclodiphosphate synthase [Rhodopirellula baltica]
MNPQEVSLPNIRIGLGYDSHRLASGGPLLIGGIEIPADVHAVGHSDADVLLHSLTDALLGAIADGDIGRLFPDTAAENKDRDSRDFVNEANARVNTQGYGIVNLDCVILAERPKMAPHIDSMRYAIAEMLGIDIGRVSIKAKTGEGVGEIGTGQSIATRVVVLLAGN